MESALATNNARIIRYRLEKDRIVPTPQLFLTCVQSGNADVVALLASHVTDINAADGAGMTPLSYAVSAGDEPVVRALLTGGADARAKNEGLDALYYASVGAGDYSAIVDMLLQSLDGLNIEQPVPVPVAVVPPEPPAAPDETCCICLTRESRVALIPCGHRCLCIGCSRTRMVRHNLNNKCPICRASFSDTLAVYG
jgi:hypothetical protein